MPNNPTRNIDLYAPISGPIVNIENVPDPVFSQKMVGDGISIDPTSNILLSPCDGEVVLIHDSLHAITIRTTDQIEVMMHIGLDTVKLKGDGLTSHVSVGQKVKVKDPLIIFDLDRVAIQSKSLLTQIIILDAPSVTINKRSGLVEAGNDKIMDLNFNEDQISCQKNNSTIQKFTSDPIIIRNLLGLHARPAAVLSKEAQRYNSTLELILDQKRCNLKSTTSIMKMEIGYNDTVYLDATGTDSQRAIQNLSQMIIEGLGENITREATHSIEDKDTKTKTFNPRKIQGIGASPGIAIGKLLKIKERKFEISNEKIKSPNEEIIFLEKCLEISKQKTQKAMEKVTGETKDIFRAHLELLNDPELLDYAIDYILNNHTNAGFSWHKSYKKMASELLQLKNELLQERSNDIIDIGEKTLKIILGIKDTNNVIEEESILLAKDLTPSEMATLNKNKIKGMCLVNCGASSHVAILARSYSIPLISGINPKILDLNEDLMVIANGDTGIIEIDPSETRLNDVRRKQEKRKEEFEKGLANASYKAKTKDGHVVDVMANIGNYDEIDNIKKFGGEGVGLVRTEFIFLNRNIAPSEYEQETIYSKMIYALDNTPLVLRTLDVGGDKPLSYLPIPKEDSPFLGERGIRVSLNRPKLFKEQLRAVIRASQKGNLEVMFPMITTIQEFREAKQMLMDESSKLNLALDKLKVGIMVEVPTVAAMAIQFAREVDFFSIGTNDLSQYMMAIDRGHPKLGKMIDGLNPGIIQMIKNTIDSAHQFNKSVSVCGSLAADNDAIPILIGLGIDKLSMSIPEIPLAKEKIRSLDFKKSREIALKSLMMNSAKEVREMVRKNL